jgi:hypothetical protein
MAYQPQYQQPYPYAQPRTSGMAVASMCVALPSAFLLLARIVQGLGFIGCFVALVLGAVALGQIRRDPYRLTTGKGMAWTGVLVSGAFLLLALVLWLQIQAGH